MAHIIWGLVCRKDAVFRVWERQGDKSCDEKCPLFPAPNGKAGRKLSYLGR